MSNRRTPTGGRPRRSDLSRRQFLGRAGLGLGAIALGPAFLAACGGATAAGGSSGGGGSKSIAISNWTSYIDARARRRTSRRRRESRSPTPRTSTTTTSTSPRSDRTSARTRASAATVSCSPTGWRTGVINQVEVGAAARRGEVPEQGEPPRHALKSPGSTPPASTASRGRAASPASRTTSRPPVARTIKTIDDFLAVKGTKTVLTEMRDTVGLFMLPLGIDTDDADLRRRRSPRSTSCRSRSTTARSTASTATST